MSSRDMPPRQVSAEHGLLREIGENCVESTATKYHGGLLRMTQEVPR